MVGTGSQAAGGAGYHFSGPSSFVASYNSQWNGSSWSSATITKEPDMDWGGRPMVQADNYIVSGGAGTEIQAFSTMNYLVVINGMDLLGGGGASGNLDTWDSVRF